MSRLHAAIADGIASGIGTGPNVSCSCGGLLVGPGSDARTRSSTQASVLCSGIGRETAAELARRGAHGERVSLSLAGRVSC